VLAVQRPTRALAVIVVTASAILTGCLIDAAQSKAARNMELAIQDDAVLLEGQYKTWQGDKPFGYAQGIGVTRIRVNMLWSYTLPKPEYAAKTKPTVLHYDFSRFDNLIDRAAAKGMRVHLSLTGPAPRWANARRYTARRAWFKPSATEFGKFAAIVADHFRGRLDRYSIWNEPNWKTWLGPLASGPTLYRNLYLRGYNAIKKADPSAKVLIGETAPFSRPGFSTSPLAFLRAVTCVNAKYKRTRACPKLKADGYAHHPYDFAHAPNYRYPGADNVTIGTLSRLTRALDKLSRTGALRKNGGGRMPVYLTEYGYFASGHRALKKRLRSKYLQQAQAIALKNPRVKSQLQYLLVTPSRGDRASFFDLGLVARSGKRNVGYNALKRWYNANRGRVKRPGGPITLPAAPPQPGTLPG
jgi:Cellulase (glycosyl hydrolase family 5)